MGRHVGALLGALWMVGRALGAEVEEATAPIATPPPKEEDISSWDTSFTLRAGGGYKSNILLSDFNREASGFVQGSADLFIFHAPTENLWEFSEFLTVEDRRYLSAKDVDQEVMILSAADLKRLVGEHFKPGLNLEYYYSDQVFDASILEGLPFRINAKTHRVSGGPTLGIILPGKRRIELAGIAAWQFIEAPLDDSLEIGPKLLFGQRFGNNSDLTLKFSYRDRAYKTRLAPERLDTLRFEQWETEAGLNNFDKERHWNSRTRVGYEWTFDNGSGFFNFEKSRISEEVGFTKGGFLANLQGKIQRYDYTTQRGLSGLGRRMTEVTVVARVEQAIWRRVKLFSEYEYEWVSATDKTDRYRATTISAGLEWEVK